MSVTRSANTPERRCKTNSSATRDTPGGFRTCKPRISSLFPYLAERKKGHWSADTQAYRRVKSLSETARHANTTDNQIARDNHRNLSNRNKNCLTSSEPSSPMKANTGYPNTLEKQDLGLKSHLMMMIEDFKKDINDSLKEIWDNTGKQVEAIKEETQKSL